MKRLFVVSVCALALFASCDNKSKIDAASTDRDSLLQVISQKNSELDNIMGTFNEIQEGFQKINEAQGRVDLAKGTAESGNSREKIRENIQFIQETMQQNRENIERLKQQLSKSTYNTTKLKEAIDNLTAELEQKTQQIQELQKELEAKNIHIAELDKTVEGLNKNVSDLSAENADKAKTVAAQDKELNSAWFVFGTKKELKEQKILQSGDVLKSGSFNKDYFTKIDIRQTKEIKLYSKSAKVLTTHPSSSYSLVKDSKEQFVLKISDPAQFWSVSKYLVIQVK
ncbi:MAG: hypothetical protein IKR18_01190 [Bacteroidaceae bacterium]|nr:hypothetical protein [Bacteroidaceae bacterium]